MSNVETRFADVFGFVKRLDDLEARLPKGGGGGTSGNVSDEWKAAVNDQLAQLHGDLRRLLVAGIAAVILLVGMICGLYVRTDDKFAANTQRLTAIEVEQVKTNAKLDRVLEAVERRGR